MDEQSVETVLGPNCGKSAHAVRLPLACDHEKGPRRTVVSRLVRTTIQTANSVENLLCSSINPPTCSLHVNAETSKLSPSSVPGGGEFCDLNMRTETVNGIRVRRGGPSPNVGYVHVQEYTSWPCRQRPSKRRMRYRDWGEAAPRLAFVVEQEMERTNCQSRLRMSRVS